MSIELICGGCGWTAPKEDFDVAGSDCDGLFCLNCHAQVHCKTGVVLLAVSDQYELFQSELDSRAEAV